MEGYSTIKVSKKNLIKLHKLAALYTLKHGRKINLNEIVEIILDQIEKNSQIGLNDIIQIDQDRNKFLEIMEKCQIKANPEDYKEYNFEDMVLPEEK